MRRLFSMVVAVSCVLYAIRAIAVDPYELMREIDSRPRGADQSMVATWRLIGRDGSERVRMLRTYWKDYRTQKGQVFSKRIAVFDSPPDISDTAFLVVSYVDASRDDDRWIYLPALRKVRRIAGGDRGQSFFGTDFAYEDLAERTADEDRHVLLRSESLNGKLHYVVESTPIDSAFPYSKRILFVDPVTATTSRIEYFDRRGNEIKVLVLDWQNVQGIWDWRRLEMLTLRTSHRTVMEVDSIGHRTGLPDALFGESALQLGVHP
jgi:hypothetical protein